ncbi:protein phosphatase methylesterase 1 [Danaus plexippus]|uniref:protein phosphatase methylesterase 1 n=1 Tax=Danaus plexippus TaxID=13037 RepID=UPI002AB25AA5|nr:protein phosphatase methylesterase 1 [Danaus plexippus]XP_061379836.1 protein phosphatase methylesterase 1 [Danaus plexippus]
MSSLEKSMMKNKLPPRMPRTSGVSKLAPFGISRRKDYTPVSWKNYFEKYVDIEIDAGIFRVYLSPEPDHPQRPRIVTLHGGGYSALSWSLFTEEITNMIHCQVVSMDIRGHGETKAVDPDDLSIETLVKDVEQVLHKLFGSELPPLILLGHSMGGAIAVRTGHIPSLQLAVQGVAVIDVVEGTAMEALASMQSFLRSRPTHFKSIEHAIEWCIRSGQVRNVESARVSMPSQIVNCVTGELATNEVEDYKAVESPLEPTARGRRDDVIAEEGEGEMEGGESTAEQKGDGGPFTKPSPVDGNMRYRWRVDLSRSERHWSGWFSGLSGSFLSTPAPRLLLLASVDGLDRDLTVGQMQGKFQMQVLTRCGHAVHEDTPSEVARVVASFALRHRLTIPTETGEDMNLISAPGC